MTFTVHRAFALCELYGLPVDYPPNGGGTLLKILVERLERHLKIDPGRGQLMGERLKAVEARRSHKSPLLLYSGLYSSDLCRRHPQVNFVFGDNLQRVGMGGQAIIRHQPNAVGVATKRSPSEFMSDTLSDMGEVCNDLIQVANGLARGVPHVIPLTPEGRISLGCGLAELPYRAPLIYAFIEKWLDQVSRTYKPEKFRG